MASPSLYAQFETNLMLSRKVIELLLHLKSAKAHGKNYRKVKLPLVSHLLRNCLLLSQAKLADIACQTLLFVSVSLGKNNMVMADLGLKQQCLPNNVGHFRLSPTTIVLSSA